MISNRPVLAGSVAATICLLALSSCMTSGKPKQSAEADAASAPAVAAAQPPMTPAEQLAASLNAKAEAQRPGLYHDPMVRTANGQQMLAQQSTSALYPPPPQAPAMAPASVASTPASIGGLVTQPTAVNANRSSIYSSPPPIMVNPDGTLAGPASAYAPQGAVPTLRSVYSTPQGIIDQQQPQMQTGVMPANQTSQANMPQYVTPSTTAPMGRPTADATPSHILPAPGSNEHRLSSQEALMVARNLADQGKNPAGAKVMPQPGVTATGRPNIVLPPGVTLTPGMSASLKQPISYKESQGSAFGNALISGKDMRDDGKLPVQSASLSSMTHGVTPDLVRQTDQVQMSCFKPALVSKLRDVEQHFGRQVIVTSGYRDPAHNHEVGGRQESLHTSCDAADIQVPGIPKAALANYLRAQPDRGGVGTYCRTESVHVDTGAARDWNWGCGGA